MPHSTWVFMESTSRSFVAGFGCTGVIAALGFRNALGENPNVLLAADADLLPLIESERQSIVATMAEQRISGAAVCLIYDGRPIWMECFGFTDLKSSRPIGMDTIFSIQSTSKNMTA